jgi:hypothetical protein
MDRRPCPLRGKIPDKKRNWSDFALSVNARQKISGAEDLKHRGLDLLIASFPCTDFFREFR